MKADRGRSARSPKYLAPLAIGLILGGPAARRAAYSQEMPHPAPIVGTEAAHAPQRLADRERRLRVAIRVNPEEAAFRARLGQTLAVQGRLDEARTSYRAAIELAPRASEYRVAQASILMRAGRPAAAEDQLRAALALEPRRPQLHAALAETLGAQERFGESADAFERAAVLDPSNREYRESTHAARRAARWPWLDVPATDQGMRLASRLLRAAAAVVLTAAGFALLLPLLGAIFLISTALPLALLRRGDPAQDPRGL